MTFKGQCFCSWAIRLAAARGKCVGTVPAQCTEDPGARVKGAGVREAKKADGETKNSTLDITSFQHAPRTKTHSSAAVIANYSFVPAGKPP